tara:strand:- start:236 stop:511 length:276 start_codon:yes stop_codon:yes gene_type:complete
MKNHVRVYLKFWGYAVSSLSQEKIPCDYCQKLNTEVHHISKRGSGGSKKKDTPENLVALCRTCHTMADHNKEFNDMVKKKLDEKIMRKIYG